MWALPASSSPLGSARWDGQFYQPHVQALLGERAGGSSLERAGRVWGEGAWQLQEGSSWHEAGGRNAWLGRSGMWQEVGAGGTGRGLGGWLRKLGGKERLRGSPALENQLSYQARC